MEKPKIKILWGGVPTSGWIKMRRMTYFMALAVVIAAFLIGGILIKQHMRQLK